MKNASQRTINWFAHTLMLARGHMARGSRSRSFSNQLTRSEKFPEDRIPFVRDNDMIAAMDQAIFQRYHDRQISLEMACKEIAKNNYLDMVTPEQFLNEYRIIGFIYD